MPAQPRYRIGGPPTYTPRDGLQWSWRGRFRSAPVVVDRACYHCAMHTTDLGALVGRYPVDNKRRRVLGLAYTIGGAAALAVGIPMMLSDTDRPMLPGEPAYRAIEMVIGGLLGLGGLAVLIGVVLLIRAAQTRGHAIDLHEHGIVRHARGAAEAIPWRDIAQVVRQGNPQNRGGLGINFRCVVRLNDGRQFAFSSHTTRAIELAERLQTAVHGRP